MSPEVCFLLKLCVAGTHLAVLLLCDSHAEVKRRTDKVSSSSIRSGRRAFPKGNVRQRQLVESHGSLGRALFTLDRTPFHIVNRVKRRHHHLSSSQPGDEFKCHSAIVWVFG
uniref:Putative secreted protein n=1 Tax=Anopheles triannulatus TaxID=58253 RepID=A0A2M4B5Z9_9DIPT